MLLAEWTAAETVLVVTAVGGQIATLAGLYFTYKKGSEAARKGSENAAAITAVKDKVIAVKTDVGAVKDQVHVIDKATNSIATQLVAKTKAAGELKGAADERARVAAKDDNTGPPGVPL
jgi:hypothetical protein